MEKLHEYQGFSGRLHEWRDTVKERFSYYKDQNIVEIAKNTASDQLKGNASASQDYSHIYRYKSRMELVRVSAAVMGIEFSYAAETAFVSPTLLQIGVKHQHMTLVWALSPLVGFFLCPILGSMSDRCKLNMGRRRPFIILLSVGVFLGLLLVPNGEDLGYWFGDADPYLQMVAMNITANETHSNIDVSPHRASASETEIIVAPKTSHPWGIFFTVLGTVLLDFDADACQSPARAYLLDVCVPDDHAKGLSTFTIMAGLGGFMGYSMGGINWDATTIGRRLGGHVKAVFTIITFIFIICVSFTITSFREIPLWALVSPKSTGKTKTETTPFDEGCTSYGTLENDENKCTSDVDEVNFAKLPSTNQQQLDYFNVMEENVCETSFTQGAAPEASTVGGINDASESVETLSHYLLSIVYMPHSLRMVCLTNLFCWMAHVCYSLYFTDFVGEAVFNGDPKAPEGTLPQIHYEEGVRFGCWGMAMYSLSCACYSLVIEKLIQRFRARAVYVGGLLFYSVGMTLMAMTRAKASVIVFSWAAGVMYSTLFTMPYLLVAHYHSMGTFELDNDGGAKFGSGVRGLGTDVAIVSSMVFLAQFILSMCMGTIVSVSGTTTAVFELDNDGGAKFGSGVRGLGTDVAIVSSMVFLAQFILSMCMGTIVSVSGTTTAVVSTASFLSFCGAIAASKIMYLDL